MDLYYSQTGKRKATFAAAVFCVSNNKKLCDKNRNTGDNGNRGGGGKALKRGQPGVVNGYSERKRNGKIRHTYRQAVAPSVKKAGLFSNAVI